LLATLMPTGEQGVKRKITKSLGRRWNSLCKFPPGMK
jgi:hypothetical protein